MCGDCWGSRVEADEEIDVGEGGIDAGGWGKGDDAKEVGVCDAGNCGLGDVDDEIGWLYDVSCGDEVD